MNSLAVNKEKMLAQAWTVPLKEMDISNWYLTEHDVVWPYFERLRKEDPVHYTEDSRYGPFWSITRFNDIKFVDQNHQLFSSQGSIGIEDQLEEFTTPMFIAMDPPKHDVQRKAVSPVVAPSNLAELEPLIRSKVSTILEGLPIGETFNWVDRVSIELTTQMLATLFDFPFEDRQKLTRWSDVATAVPGAGIVDSEEQRRAELIECLQYFTQLWEERKVNPGSDLVSMLAHGEETHNMEPLEFLGNLILLIVGGNDTTRNSMTGGVYALNQFSSEFAKLKNNPALIPNMVAEIIRWQTPLAYMRRTANHDIEVGGKSIKAGDQLLMWYVSGNRDETAFERPNDLVIDRPNARGHLSFGFGIHRCMGNRLAEMQLRILWEEILERFDDIQVLAEPERTYSSFVKGYTKMMVTVTPK